MRKIILGLSIIICCSAIALYANQKNIQGNGKTKTEKRITTAYDRIQVFGSTDVELIAGTEGQLTVTADENLLEYIETSVENYVLTITLKNNHSYNTKIPMKVLVPIQEISHLSVKGSGDISSKILIKGQNLTMNVAGSGDISAEVDNEYLTVAVIGSGDIELKGKANKFSATLEGSGDINAKGLVTAFSNLKVKGSGAIEVNVKDEVSANVQGSGDIKVSGNPSRISKVMKGSGSVIIK